MTPGRPVSSFPALFQAIWGYGVAMDIDLEDFLAAANEQAAKGDLAAASFNAQMAQIALLKQINDKLGRILFHERWS